MVSADLANEVDRQLALRALSFIGLARRAGVLVAGFDNVRRAIAAGEAAVLIEASDAGVHGGAKLRKAAARPVPTVSLFGRAELSRSLGRDEVVHVALAPSPIADQFLSECVRLAGFRGGHMSPDQPGGTSNGTQ